MTETGQRYLEKVWWDTIEELHELVVMGEANNRINAADTLLRYFAALNLGINAPFIPEERSDSDDDDE